jgi:hypothetical protein
MAPMKAKEMNVEAANYSRNNNIFNNSNGPLFRAGESQGASIAESPGHYASNL